MCVGCHYLYHFPLHFIGVGVGRLGQAISAHRSVLQQLNTAHLAGRPVDYPKIASHELMSVPINIMTTDGRLRLPTDKAALQNILLGSKDQYPTLIPGYANAALLIDCMWRIRSMGKPQNCSTFGDLADAFASSVFNDTIKRYELVCDNYSTRPSVSIKSQTWESRKPSGNCS